MIHILLILNLFLNFKSVSKVYWSIIMLNQNELIIEFVDNKILSYQDNYMKVSISSEINFQSFSNCLNLKIALTTGQCQVLPNHLPLVGSINTDIVEVESLNDLNEKLKTSYLLQDAVVVITQDQEALSDGDKTAVYIYARRMLDLSSTLSIEELSKNLSEKEKSYAFELNEFRANGENEGQLASSKMMILSKEITFLQKACLLLKEKTNV